MSNNKIRSVIKKIIKLEGSHNIKDMGKVMGLSMKKLSGLADGKRVEKIVKEELS